MSETKKRLKQLLKDFTKGVGVNKDSFHTFVNEEGKKLPAGWNTVYKILRQRYYEPKMRITKLLLDYFNEPYHIKDGAVKIGAEKTGEDGNNDNN